MVHQLSNTQFPKLKDIKWKLELSDNSIINETETGHWSDLSSREVLKSGEIIKVYSGSWKKIKLVLDDLELLCVEAHEGDRVFFRRRMVQPTCIDHSFMLAAEIGVIRKNKIILHKIDMYAKVTILEKIYDRN